MSVTGPGCDACNFTGRVCVATSDDRPCDACGGFSQFRHRDEAAVLVPAAGALAGVPIANMRGDVVAFAGRAVLPEDDWRPLPSVAEVLAHNARTGGGDFGPWLALRRDPEERVEVVYIAADDFGGVIVRDANHDRVRLTATEPDPLLRPITRRGGALPWPEVPR